MQSSTLIDSHCHLDFDTFSHDLPVILNTALALGMTDFILSGVHVSQWNTLLNVHQAFPQCHYAVGLHPYFLSHYSQGDIEKLPAFIAQHSPVAVGEIGLDFLHDKFQPPDEALQLFLLDAQLNIAQHAKLPVILHARKTYDVLLKYIRLTGFTQGGVVHAFNGSLQQAKQFIEYGFCLGIGGSITYPRGEKLLNILAQLPSSAFVLETDSPDMPLYGFQGQRNTPLQLPLIAQALATHLNISYNDIAQLTTSNTQRVFHLKRH